MVVRFTKIKKDKVYDAIEQCMAGILF